MSHSPLGTRPRQRQRWAHVESARDVEVLVWIARFQFVTLDVLAARFEVSVARAGVRVRRLEQLGYVRRVTGLVSQAHAIYLAPPGARHIGSPRRRAPRPSLQRDHELALTQLVCRLELARPDFEVLTERDARQRECDGDQRFSVDVRAEHGGTAKRWPDVTLTNGRRTVALEVEFAAKGTERLRRIIEAYIASPMAEARFFVIDPVVAGRIARLRRDLLVAFGTSGARLCKIEIVPWTTVTAETRERIIKKVEVPGSSRGWDTSPRDR